MRISPDRMSIGQAIRTVRIMLPGEVMWRMRVLRRNRRLIILKCRCVGLNREVASFAEEALSFREVQKSLICGSGVEWVGDFLFGVQLAFVGPRCPFME